MEELLKKLNPQWEGKKLFLGISRIKYLDILVPQFGSKQIILITGMRRVGKTIIMNQLINNLILRGISPKRILYITLDHIFFEGKKITDIISKFREMNKLKKNEKVFLFFDEVQHIANWDQEVKNIYDLENVKIILSGSSSTQLKQRSAYLTGRVFTFQIFPLDFKEFLEFKKIPQRNAQKAVIDYLRLGGLPEYVLSEDLNYPSNLINNILKKDIVSVYGLKFPKVLDDLLISLAERVGYKTSFAKLKNILGISLDTVKEYIGYLQDANVIHQLEKYSYSVNERIYSHKKYYFSDTGLRAALIGFKDMGSLAENAVFSYLHNNNKEQYYLEEGVKEIDFIVEDKKGLIGVESKFAAKPTKQQIQSLIEISKRNKLTKLVIVTESEEKKESNIELIPLWKFLLDYNI